MATQSGRDMMHGINLLYLVRHCKNKEKSRPDVFAEVISGRTYPRLTWHSNGMPTEIDEPLLSSAHSVKTLGRTHGCNNHGYHN